MLCGILTLTSYKNDNYSAYLQAWASKVAIERYTQNQATVLPIEQDPFSSVLKKYPLNSGLIAAIRRKFAIKKRQKKITRDNKNTRIQLFQDFLFRYAVQKGIHSFYYDEIEENTKDISCFVIGSDWVWYLSDNELKKPLDNNNNKSIYFGNWDLKPNQKRIGYAISQGIIPSFKSDIFIEACKRFSALSFREKESITYLRDIVGIPLNIPLEHVVDPTLLLQPDDLKDIEIDTDSLTLNIKKYIVAYILPTQDNDRISTYISQLEHKTNIEVILINKKNEFYIKNHLILGEKMGPREFLSMIKNAEYVVTNSFHGMVFSILYQKRFTAFSRQRNDFRQKNLIEGLQLNDRMLDKPGVDPYNKQIDWESVMQLKNIMIKNSINYLKNNI